ncbi:hypothetical protein PV325_002935 [Microctonus aethiopoides]|nr:hypothetical protein PV325_002935 [Microctonus aethiopoides]
MCDILQKKKRCTFKECWIDDEKFKNWIQKVPLNEEMYHCSVCNKDIMCSTYPSRHAATGKHKYHMNYKKIDQNFCHSCMNIKESGRVLFKKSWLEFELFKPWLREVPDDEYSFFCLTCEKIMGARLSQVYRHAESLSHLKAVKAHTSKIIEEDNRIETINMNSSFDERRKYANSRYAMFIEEKKIPLHIAAELLDFFQELNREPEILQSMRMGKIECENVISYFLYSVKTNHKPDQNVEKNPIET